MRSMRKGSFSIVLLVLALFLITVGCVHFNAPVNPTNYNYGNGPEKSGQDVATDGDTESDGDSDCGHGHGGHGHGGGHGGHGHGGGGHNPR